MSENLYTGVSAHTVNSTPFSAQAPPGFSIQSGFDLECAENTCLPSPRTQAQQPSERSKRLPALPTAQPVPPLSAYAYKQAVPLVLAEVFNDRLDPTGGEATARPAVSH